MAATALAFAAMRTDFFWPDLALFEGPAAYSDYLYRANVLTIFMSPAFASLSVAVLFLRIRKPRPVLRRLIRQPGFVACTATAIILVIRIANLAAVLGVLTLDLPGEPFWDWFLEEAETAKTVPSDIGCAVAVAWTIQRIGGRWRSEPCWIDRAGRVLGVLWVTTIPFAWFTYMIVG